MAEWRWIDGYVGRYEVSDEGQVRSYVRSRSGHVLSDRINNKGYKLVQLTSEDRCLKEYLVHRLVAAAFVENEHDMPVVNHLDNDPLNNRAENLEWTDCNGNMRHAAKQGRIPSGVDSNMSPFSEEQIVEIRALCRSGMTQGALAQRYRVNQSTISRIVRFETHKR